MVCTFNAYSICHTCIIMKPEWTFSMKLMSFYNNRFWITGDGNKALWAWVTRVLWCHTITHHMPHTELMHACWYSNGSSCFPSRTGRKLIQRSFRFLSRQRPEGQIWYLHCKPALSDDEVVVYLVLSRFHLPSQVLVGVVVHLVSVRAGLISRSTAGTPPSLDLQWYSSSSHAKKWQAGGILFDPLTFAWFLLEMHFCHSFLYRSPSFYLAFQWGLPLTCVAVMRNQLFDEESTQG